MVCDSNCFFDRRPSVPYHRFSEISSGRTDTFTIEVVALILRRSIHCTGRFTVRHLRQIAPIEWPGPLLWLSVPRRCVTGQPNMRLLSSTHSARFTAHGASQIQNKSAQFRCRLLIVGHDLGRGLVRFKLCAHFLNLRCLLFHCRGESLHSGF